MVILVVFDRNGEKALKAPLWLHIFAEDDLFEYIIGFMQTLSEYC